MIAFYIFVGILSAFAGMICLCISAELSLTFEMDNDPLFRIGAVLVFFGVCCVSCGVILQNNN